MATVRNEWQSYPYHFLYTYWGSVWCISWDQDSWFWHVYHQEVSSEAVNIIKITVMSVQTHWLAYCQDGLISHVCVYLHLTLIVKCFQDQDYLNFKLNFWYVYLSTLNWFTEIFHNMNRYYFKILRMHRSIHIFMMPLFYKYWKIIFTSTTNTIKFSTTAYTHTSFPLITFILGKYNKVKKNSLEWKTHWWQANRLKFLD